MPRLLAVCLLAGCAVTVALAGPTEAAIVAVMRLSDQSNYSWVATVSDDARTYDISGQTVTGAFTRVKMPVINSVRRRLGRSVTDTQIEFIFRGNVTCVIATDDGWLRPGELPPPPEVDSEVDRIVNPAGSTGTPGARSISGGVIKGTVIRSSSSPPGDTDERQRGYSNLQLAISHPHEELGVIVSSHTEFKVEGEVVSGTLTDLGAQLLLVRDGQKEITPVRAAGTFKLWLREGLVSRYQVRLEGVLQVNTPGGRRQVAVNQNTETVLKEIGTTRFEVPDQARIKLGR